MKQVLYAVVLLFFVGCGGSEEKSFHPKSWAMQLQNAEPSEIAHSGFDIVVMDYSKDGQEKYTPGEIAMIKSAGVKPIAYLSIGEAEDYRSYWQEEWYENPPVWLGEENDEWSGNYAVIYWDPQWQAIIKNYLDEIIEQGFDGVYLDKVDEFEYWSGFLSEAESAKRMSEFIKDLAEYARSKKKDFLIIPQNGEKILAYDETLLDVVSGWGAEDLFYDETTPWSMYEEREIQKQRLIYLDRVVQQGKPVFSIDYVDDGSGYCCSNKERIDDYRAKALQRGYIPYAAMSDRELDELNIIEGVQP